MRILTFTSLYPNSVNPQHGIFIETRLRELVARQPVEARVVAPVPWFPIAHPFFGRYADFARVPPYEERGGISVLHPRYPVLPRIGALLAPAALYWRTLPVLRRLRREGFGFDLIDAHYFFPDGVAAARLGRALGVPVVISARGSDINVIPEDPAARQMILAAARDAAGLIAVSTGLRRRMVELGIPESRITVLRNGVDTGRFAPEEGAREALGLPAGMTILASVGNLVPVKDFALAIAVLRELPGSVLLLAGEGPLRGELARLAQSLGLAERVRFLGRLPQERLRLVYSAADLLLLTSLSEGWPNVVLEAMACGSPVVSVPLPGIEEIITNPRVGAVAADRRPSTLAQAARRLLEGPAERGLVRAHADTFGWQATALGIYDLFTRILSSR
ncbi:MAG: glycosyltransferase family 4 protein [Alphaproteobacteria bacterium]|nr:glycosyltransferase family 4 protein [Alphaproteobacteria bacterium]